MLGELLKRNELIDRRFQPVATFIGLYNFDNFRDCVSQSFFGIHDRFFFVEQDVLELSAKIPNMKRVDFENAGHMIPMERPEEFADELLNFLSTI